MSIESILDKLAEKKLAEGSTDMAFRLLKQSNKSSFKSTIKDIDGFLNMNGDDFIFSNKEDADKALVIAESAANFLKWKVSEEGDKYKLSSEGKDNE